MGIIVFNGVSSKDVGIEVEAPPSYEVPEREYEAIHVPGRNGDVIIDNGTFKNTERSYKVSIATYNKISYSQKMSGVAKWLHSTSGYTRLEDSYEPEFFTLAYFKDRLTLENLFNEAGRGTLKFICKPQRYYKYGEQIIDFSTTGKIQNRTTNIALPQIYVNTDNTAGSVTITGVKVEIIAGSGTSFIMDSELQDAYTAAGDNKNSFVKLKNGMFPILYPGENTVTFDGGVTGISIKPNWWSI